MKESATIELLRQESEIAKNEAKYVRKELGAARAEIAALIKSGGKGVQAKLAALNAKLKVEAREAVEAMAVSREELHQLRSELVQKRETHGSQCQNQREEISRLEKEVMELSQHPGRQAEDVKKALEEVKKDNELLQDSLRVMKGHMEALELKSARWDERTAQKAREIEEKRGEILALKGNQEMLLAELKKKQNMARRGFETLAATEQKLAETEINIHETASDLAEMRELYTDMHADLLNAKQLARDLAAEKDKILRDKEELLCKKNRSGTVLQSAFCVLRALVENSFLVRRQLEKAIARLVEENKPRKDVFRGVGMVARAADAEATNAGLERAGLEDQMCVVEREDLDAVYWSLF